MVTTTTYQLHIPTDPDIARTAIEDPQNPTILDAAAGSVWKINSGTATEETWIVVNASLVGAVWQYKSTAQALATQWLPLSGIINTYFAISSTAGTNITWLKTASIAATTSPAANLVLTSANAGGLPSLSVSGSGVNIDASMILKGTSVYHVGNVAGDWFQVTGPATGPTNFLQATGEPSGVFPGIIALGTDPNVTLDLFAKASAQVVLGSLNASQTTTGVWGVFQGSVTPTNNYLSFTGNPAGTAPSMAATGTDPNVDISLVPKGTGGVQVGGVIKNTGATATMGITEKKGSGVGNYSTVSATYADIDTTNLSLTVTIPIGWKALILFRASVFQSGSNVTSVALADVTTVLKESINSMTSAAGSDIFISHTFPGDGASHTFRPRWNTSAPTLSAQNGSATNTPVMTVMLMPSN